MTEAKYFKIKRLKKFLGNYCIYLVGANVDLWTLQSSGVIGNVSHKSETIPLSQRWKLIIQIAL